MQSFSNAVTNRRRNGLGKIVLEYYDTLTNLFAGSASVKALKYGLQYSFSSISTSTNSPAADLEVENNSVSDVTNGASGNIFSW